VYGSLQHDFISNYFIFSLKLIICSQMVYAEELLEFVNEGTKRL
jgi:hypothetical protein